YAICPECGSEVTLGAVGLPNLTKRHMGKKICLKVKAARDKHAKKSHTSLLNFFQLGPITRALVPSTIAPAMAIQPPAIQPMEIPVVPVSIPLPIASPPACEANNEPIQVRDFLETLQQLIADLPSTVPEATDYDSLAIFGTHPEGFDDLTLDTEELWEKVLNQLLKSALGWGTEGDMDKIIRRGRKGLDGLTNFVRYFV
ncbi:hypothetical protein BDZ97DRAFT_1646178, partial [Flammula alnicola]